jgi:hypothetical protein
MDYGLLSYESQWRWKMQLDSNLRQILGLDDSAPRVKERNRRGVMVYSHKTAGAIQVFTNESWERNKKYYVPRQGSRSVMKKF